MNNKHAASAWGIRWLLRSVFPGDDAAADNSLQTRFRSYNPLWQGFFATLERRPLLVLLSAWNSFHIASSHWCGVHLGAIIILMGVFFPFCWPHMDSTLSCLSPSPLSHIITVVVAVTSIILVVAIIPLNPLPPHPSCPSHSSLLFKYQPQSSATLSVWSMCPSNDVPSRDLTFFLSQLHDIWVNIIPRLTLTWLLWPPVV